VGRANERGTAARYGETGTRVTSIMLMGLLEGLSMVGSGPATNARSERLFVVNHEQSFAVNPKTNSRSRTGV
jgi:hypothetical protein